MELSIKNYRESLPVALLKLAEKNTVRECDEIEKGSYVAYVDEGDDSYDVSLVISSNGEIKTAECDCKNSKAFCRHKAALLLQIAGSKKEKKTAKVKVKINKSDALLDDASLHELKEWIRNLLQKNPDIELAFTHHFSAKNHQFTKEEIEKITNDALRAVVKNKKNIDPTQLKKIIELWADIHAPIVQQYQAGAADEKMFGCFHALLECCMNIHFKLNVTSKKIPAYADSLLKACAETVANIYDEAAWAAATGYFVQHILHKEQCTVRFHYLQHIENIISVSNEKRKTVLLDAVVKQYSNSDPGSMAYGANYTQRIFAMVEQLGMFEKYHTVFEPVEWSNTYNEKLISLLIEIKQYGLAEKYSLKQIAGNYREEYNVPYLKLLKQIYTINGNESGMASVLAQLFPYTFLFEDYLYITARMKDEEERKKWRTKILSRVRSASRSYNNGAILFCFQLANHEKKYTKMIEYIDSRTPYSVILAYFEPMALTDKVRLLQALLRKSDDYGWGASSEVREKNEAVVPDLYAAMLKHYTAGYLKAAISKNDNVSWYGRRGALIEYLKKELRREGDVNSFN